MLLNILQIPHTLEIINTTIRLFLIIGNDRKKITNYMKKNPTTSDRLEERKNVNFHLAVENSK